MRKLNYLEFLGLSLGISQWYEDSLAEKMKLKTVIVDEKEDFENIEMNVGLRVVDEIKEIEEKELDNVVSSDVDEVKVEKEGEMNDSSVDGLAQSVLDISLADKTPEKEEKDNSNTDEKVNEESTEECNKQLATLPLSTTALPIIFDPEESSHWKCLVTKIRIEEFGVGIHLEGQGGTLLMKQEERLGRWVG